MTGVERERLFGFLVVYLLVCPLPLLLIVGGSAVMWVWWVLLLVVCGGTWLHAYVVRKLDCSLLGG